MADFKISELDAISGSSIPATSDFIVNDTTAGTSAAVTKRINLGELKTAIGGGFAPMLISFGRLENINEDTYSNLATDKQNDSQGDTQELTTVSKNIDLPFGSNSAMLIITYYDEIRMKGINNDTNKDVIVKTITNTIRTITFTNAALSTGGNTVTYESFAIRETEDTGRVTMPGTQMLNISRNGSSNIVMEVKLDLERWRNPDMDSLIADVMVFPYASPSLFNLPSDEISFLI